MIYSAARARASLNAAAEAASSSETAPERCCFETYAAPRLRWDDRMGAGMVGVRAVLAMLLTVALLVACSPGNDQSTNDQQVDDQPGNGAPAEGPCRFISSQELGKLTGLSAGEPFMLGSDHCSFTFAEAPHLQVTVIRLDSGDGSMCPSCIDPVKGFGKQAAWSDSSDQLNVLMDGRQVVIYVAFGGPDLDSKDLAIRIFKFVEPRTWRCAVWFSSAGRSPGESGVQANSSVAHLVSGWWTPLASREAAWQPPSRLGGHRRSLRSRPARCGRGGRRVRGGPAGTASPSGPRPCTLCVYNPYVVYEVNVCVNGRTLTPRRNLCG